MFRMGAVREVQTGNIHTHQTHLCQYFFVFTGGADSADNLGFAHGIASCVHFYVYVILPYEHFSVNLKIGTLPHNASARNPAEGNTQSSEVGASADRTRAMGCHFGSVPEVHPC